MRLRTILCLALVAFASPSQASASDWWFTVKLPESVRYADMSTLKVNGDQRTLWLRWQVTTAAPLGGIRYIQVRARFDCDELSFTTLTALQYGEDDQVKRTTDPQPKIYLAPNSYARKEAEFICRFPTDGSRMFDWGNGLPIGSDPNFAKSATLVKNTER